MAISADTISQIIYTALVLGVGETTVKLMQNWMLSVIL